METRILDRQAMVPPQPSPSRMLLAWVSMLWLRIASVWRRCADALLLLARSVWERFLAHPLPALEAAAEPDVCSIEVLPDIEPPPASGPRRIARDAPTRYSGVTRIA